MKFRGIDIAVCADRVEKLVEKGKVEMTWEEMWRTICKRMVPRINTRDHDAWMHQRSEVARYINREFGYRKLAHRLHAIQGYGIYITSGDESLIEEAVSGARRMRLKYSGIIKEAYLLAQSSDTSEEGSKMIDRVGMSIEDQMVATGSRLANLKCLPKQCRDAIAIEFKLKKKPRKKRKKLTVKDAKKK